MASPTRYQLSYDFTSFQASNPTDPLPADRIEIEFNNLETTTDEIIDNLNLIQRSDGALANNSVGVDQLKAEVSNATNPATDWATLTAYVVNDTVYENNSIYRCLISHTSGTFSTDLAAGRWELFINTGQFVDAAAASATAAATSETNAATSETNAATSETNAATSETNAATSESNAAASATAAQNAVDSVFFRDTKSLTNADSPYTVLTTDKGLFISVDTSSGNVIMNLPQISTVTFPYAIRIKKETSDGNTVTINRGGTDTFNDGSTSKTIQSVGGIDLVAEDEGSPDVWKTALFGAAAGNMAVDTFIVGTDVSAGATSLTLSTAPGSANNAWMMIDGLEQDVNQYSISGVTLTYPDGIPTGAKNIQVRYGTTLSVGTPSDGSVDTDKLADLAVTYGKTNMRSSVAEAQAGTANQSFMTPLRVKQAIEAIELPRMIVRHTEASGTNGGQRVSNNTWTQRKINTEVENTITGASLSSNVITLPAGTYRVRGYQSFNNTGAAKTRLRNTDDSSTELVGQSTNVAGSGAFGASHLNGEKFTLSAEKDLEFQYEFAGTSGGTGDLGLAASSGETEIYADYEIIKVG